mgnify:CR=1 FL=1
MKRAAYRSPVRRSRLLYRTSFRMDSFRLVLSKTQHSTNTTKRSSSTVPLQGAIERVFKAETQSSDFYAPSLLAAVSTEQLTGIIQSLRTQLGSYESATLLSR